MSNINAQNISTENMSVINLVVSYINGKPYQLDSYDSCKTGYYVACPDCDYIGENQCECGNTCDWCDTEPYIPDECECFVPYEKCSKSGPIGATGPTGSKTFIIDHPKDKSKFLVHGCLEGPEVGVYYRGISEITNNHSIQIDLPLYIPDWATDFTTNITAIYDGKIKVFAVSEVNKNGFFNVYGENGKFNWVAIGKRDVINIEPFKTEINVKGFGPYKWVE
jgi:hypothetical protein